DTFDPQRIEWRRRFDVRDLDLGYLHRGRHQEVHEACVQELTAVVEVQPLIERAADTLRHPAVDLTFHDRGIDHHATIVNHDIAHEPNVAGGWDNFDDSGVLAASPGRALGRKEALRFQSRRLARGKDGSLARFDQL